MENKTLLILQITQDTKNWTCRITITEEMSILTCSNTSSLKRYVFTDDEGNEIVASVYDADVSLLTPALVQFVVYDISNAFVRPIEPMYRILNKPFQWQLQRNTLIQKVPKATPNLRYFLDGIMPIRLIVNSLDHGDNTVDIMGVVIEAGEHRTINTEYGVKAVQRFIFANTERIPVGVSLWGEMVQSEGPKLEAAARSFSVVVAKRLKTTRFRGVSLSARNSSSFTVDPFIEAAAGLKSWFDSVREVELPNLLTDNSVMISREHVQSGAMRTHSVEELGNSTVCGDYWLKGHLQLIDEDQRLYYIGCNNCFTKINATDGLQYTCFLCNKEVVACLRLIVAMTVADDTGDIKVVAVDSVAEKILQTTTTEIGRLLRMRTTYDLASARAAFDGKVFLMLVRRTYARRLEGQRRLLLVDYFHDDAPEPIAVLPLDCSDKGKAIELSTSPSKRQMPEIAPNAGLVAKKPLLGQANGHGISIA